MCRKLSACIRTNSDAPAEFRGWPGGGAGLLPVARTDAALGAAPAGDICFIPDDIMLLEPLEFARHDRTGGHELFATRIDESADNKEPREPCGCLILLPLVRGGSDDQVADQLTGADDAVVLNPAAMGIAQEETAICRDAGGIVGARAGDQQGGDARRCEQGHGALRMQSATENTMS